LSAVERVEHIAEWVALVSSKLDESPETKIGRPGAQAAAARELGESATSVKRATKIASLPQDVRDQARAEDWSQHRLLQAARPAPKAPPVAADPLEEDEAIEGQVKRLMAAWNNAGPDARKEFLSRVRA
jgi:hypothetical protein